LIVGPGVPDADDVLAAARANGAPIILLEEDAERQGKALATYAYTKLDRRRVRIVRDEKEPAFERLADAFSSTWRERGGAIVDQAEKGSELREGRYVSGEVWYDVTPYAGAPMPGDKVREWRARFEKRFRLAPTADALLGHGGLGIFLAALEESETPTRKPLLEKMAGRKTFPSLTGTLRQIDGRWRWPLFLVRHQGEKAEVVETVPVPES
jgi:hypothetical protein